jgi:hypothetical protein
MVHLKEFGLNLMFPQCFGSMNSADLSLSDYSIHRSRVEQMALEKLLARGKSIFASLEQSPSCTDRDARHKHGFFEPEAN